METESMEAMANVHRALWIQEQRMAAWRAHVEAAHEERERWVRKVAEALLPFFALAASGRYTAEQIDDAWDRAVPEWQAIVLAAGRDSTLPPRDRLVLARIMGAMGREGSDVVDVDDDELAVELRVPGEEATVIVGAGINRLAAAGWLRVDRRRVGLGPAALEVRSARRLRRLSEPPGKWSGETCRWHTAAWVVARARGQRLRHRSPELLALAAEGVDAKEAEAAWVLFRARADELARTRRLKRRTTELADTVLAASAAAKPAPPEREILQISDDCIVERVGDALIVTQANYEREE